MKKESLNQGKRIGVIGTQSSTMNCIEGLIRGGYTINHLITVPPELKDGIADYQDLSIFARERKIPFTCLATYAMKDKKSRERLADVNLDAIIVVGWQRLIPDWLLDKTPLGVYGMHGSSLPLPKGRGRSPMNWSILQQKDRFYTYLFRYDSGVDSGDIIALQRFNICSWDTIQSLQHKNTVSQYLLLLKNLPAILTGNICPIPQDTSVTPSYYPKRTPEDGSIDWRNWAAREIYALIRAVTKPYPGAYTMMHDKKVMIWRAAPFDSCIQFTNAAPGEIVEVFTDGSFIVQCFLDTLLVLEYEAYTGWKPKIGEVFQALSNASWEKLAQMQMGLGDV
jgi:UDP-4-amino-4-deoxy-L-arabinose formyltransferase/UDP-glucuronic acid dehydrogenase (UDP-4-keto-hexauronic acid decarboxylating)